MALTKIGSIGINTGIQFAGVTTVATLNASDNVLSVGGTVNFVSDVSIGGTVSIAGTLTYEDVTNIDAVGLITARNGVVVGSGITLSKDGDIFATGIVTASSFVGGLPITDGADNRIITATSASAIQGESGLTFDGDILSLTKSSTTAYDTAATTNDSATNLINSGAAGHSTLQFQSVSGGSANTGQATISVFNESSGSKNTALTFGTRQNSDATIRERLRIDASGHLHTGYTSSFGGDHINILATDGGGISIATNNAGNASANDVIGSYSFQGYLNGQTHTNAEAKISAIAAANHTGSSAATDMVFYTKPSSTGPGSAPTERLRIKSDGKVFLHGTSATGANNTSALLPAGYTLNVHGTNSNDGISVVRYSGSYGAYGLNIGRSRNDTFGTNTAVQSGDELGHVTFYGADGTNFDYAAQITGLCDGAVGTGGDATDMPGALSFRTTPEGSDSPTERLRIDSSGRTLLNNLGNATPGLSANADDLVIGYGTESNETGITMFSTTNSGIRFNDNSGTDAAIEYGHSDREMRFNAAGANRLTFSVNAASSPVFNMGVSSGDANNHNKGDRTSVKVGDYLYIESATGAGHNTRAGLGYNCYFHSLEDFYCGTNSPISGDNRPAAYGMAYGNHYFYSDASNTAHSAQAQLTMSRVMEINRTGNVKASVGSFDSLIGYTVDVSVDTSSWAQNTFYRVVNDNVFDNSNDTYLVWFKWSHGGSGAPWIITGNFIWTSTGTNVTGAASHVFTPVQSTHNSTATISFQGVADGQVRQGLQARADTWDPSGGTLYIKASKIGHPSS